MDIIDAVELVHLVLLLFVPGLVFLLVLPGSIRDPATAVVGALVISFTYTVLLGAAFLRLGLFGEVALSLGLVPVALMLWARLDVARANATRWWKRRGRLLAPCCAAGVVAVAVVVTPRWTFLVASHMDAGNYEVYSNHFWTTGSLYLQANELLASGVPLDWIRFTNTWLFDGTVGQPTFFYAYPVLLGLTKSTFGSFAVSWVLNGFFACSSAFALVVLARRFVDVGHLAFAIVLPATATPLFFYYSKQVMSEGLALFALTAVLVWLLSRSDRSLLATALTTGAGCALLLLAKIDVIVPTVLVVCAVAATVFLRGRRAVPAGAASGVVVGFVVAALFDVWLVADSYLAKFSPATFVRSWEQTPLAGDVMLLSTSLGLVGIVVIAIRTGGEDGSNLGGHLRTAHRILPWTLVLLWWAFMAWNLLLRPGTGSLESNHDALNLVRLLTVFSPLGIATLTIGVPTLVRTDALSRWITVALLTAVALVIFRSSHVRSEVWWMRRYLATLVPTTVVVTAVTVAWLRERSGRWRPTVVTGAAVALVGVAVVQGANMRPLFAHEVNVNAPERLGRLLREVPDGVPLVVLEDHDRSLVQGAGNILRSLRAGPTLVDVPPGELSTALSMFEPDPVAVMSADPLADGTMRAMDLELAYEGMYAAQWESWLGEIAEDPAREEPQPFYVYRRGTRAGS